MFCRMLSIVGLLTLLGAAPPPEKRLPATINLGTAFATLSLAPRAQGERNTCSLFAITALAEFEIGRANPRARQRLSEEFLTWAANEATGRTGDQAMFYEAVHGLNMLGLCTADLMPYEPTSDARRKPSTQALRDAKSRSQRWKAHWIKRWDVRRGLSSEELTAIKTALANGHPVACGLRWPKALKGASLLEVPRPGDVFDGHSIVFTGYAEDATKKGGGVFFFRNSFGPTWGKNGFGEMSYAYARAYANDALWLELGPPGSESPVERFEAESMPILARTKCVVGPQKMDAWGGGLWSRRTQLFGRSEQGGSVELGFTVRQAGRYRLRLLATAAPDFGIIRVVLDGKPQPPGFDLYAGRVCPSGSLELGEHILTASAHRLRFIAVGKNTASKGFFFGLDAVDLLPLK